MVLFVDFMMTGCLTYGCFCLLDKIQDKLILILILSLLCVCINKHTFCYSRLVWLLDLNLIFLLSCITTTSIFPKWCNNFFKVTLSQTFNYSFFLLTFIKTAIFAGLYKYFLARIFNEAHILKYNYFATTKLDM